MSTWGVVQKFELEADRDAALIAAIQIALIQHSSFTHYHLVNGWTGKDSSDPVETLHLDWGGKGPSQNGIPFLTPLTQAEDIAIVVRNWLAQVEYPPAPRTDGSTSKGFRATIDRNGWSYHALSITPVWIIYGK